MSNEEDREALQAAIAWVKKNYAWKPGPVPTEGKNR